MIPVKAKHSFSKSKYYENIYFPAFPWHWKLLYYSINDIE